MIQDKHITKLCSWLKKMGPDKWDELLDKRTGGEFEKEWIRVNELLVLENKQWPGLEKAFLKLSGLTKQHEIVDYISDDLELIYRGEIRKIKDEFLKRLSESYQNGIFPT
jgi:hypothetical protein